MKILAGTALLVGALFLGSCGGPDSDTSPFVGKIEFKANMLGMDTKGSITMNGEEEMFTYRVDALEDVFGSDLVMMMDMKNKKSYSISPSKKIYMKMDSPEGELEKNYPTKKEVEELRREFFSKLKKTGKTLVIHGLTCDEYEIIAKMDDIESGKIWVSKTMMNRMTTSFVDMAKLKELGLEELMIGFPMKATIKSKQGNGSFEVTKISEGEAFLTDFDLSKYKELSNKEFMKEMIGGSTWEDIADQLDEMEDKGVIEDLKEEMKNLENLKELTDQIDTKDLEKYLDKFK